MKKGFQVFVGGRGDTGARNLFLLLFAVIGGLSCFLSFLVWNSFTSSAPTVWANSSFSSKHIFPQIYESDFHQAAELLPSGSFSRQLSPIERGERLYRNIGCILCHGPEGRGDVKNPNYIKDTFPALNQIASRLFLEYEEDAELVIDMLSSGISLDEPSNIDIPGSSRISAGYQSVSHVTFTGNPGGKKDPNGNKPISMPSYKDILTQSDLDDLIAYFLTLYDWEEEVY